MKDFEEARRQFLKATGYAAGALLLSRRGSLAHIAVSKPHIVQAEAAQNVSSAAAYTRSLRRESNLSCVRPSSSAATRKPKSILSLTIQD